MRVFRAHWSKSLSVRFFSGFSLQGEAHFFEPYLRKSDYTVAGFSYGAIHAFEFTCNATQRIDTLQLFSPAFFQTRDARFIKVQERGYRSDPQRYLQNFLALCFQPYEARDTLHVNTTEAELHELLHYTWPVEQLEALQARGVVIEVYLGGEDAIIDAAGAQEFFKRFATVYWISKANHFLLEE